MDFTVRQWMVDLIFYIDPESLVSDALTLMRRRYISSIIVNKAADNPEFGIITSTDICDKILAQDRNPYKTKVREIMHSPLITIDQDLSLRECSQIMMKNHIHHLPVVDNSGILVGMISATDFLVAAEAIGRDPGLTLT